MSGIFHSLKKTLVKGDARPDVEFIDAKTRFEQYSETLIKLKGNIANYLSHATAIYINSSQIAQDFATLIDDPDQKVKTDYTETVVSMRQEHQTLASEQVPKLQSTFSTQLLSAIDDECIKNNEIAKKIARRMELFSELGYYQSKVNELRDEREKRSGKGKPESADNIEKFDRNCKKLEEIRASYTELNTRIMGELNRLWEADRVRVMGPIMCRFIAQEKKVAEAYTEALQQIKVSSASPVPQ